MTTEIVTLKQAAEKYLANLRELGKNETTVTTYGRHLDLAIAFFGESKDLAKMLPAHVAAFFKSDAVNKTIREPKKEGEQRIERIRSHHTSDQTRRVMKQLLVFCVEQGIIEKTPLPKSEQGKAKANGDSASVDNEAISPGDDQQTSAGDSPADKVEE